MRSAQKRLAPVLKPLLELVAEWTGLKYVTLIAGSLPEPGETKCCVACIHFGEMKDKVPKNFAEWDPDSFSKKVLSHFGRFLEYVRGK